ncbi:MAG: aminotransferase class V-fold PLP-dependent enzyme, partial [Micrococcales bacterium]|nr:aminotransferase class V-fold PLP-dependent enzyme [Micrococcales bacterium]
MSTHHAGTVRHVPAPLARRLPAVVRPDPAPLATGGTVEYAQLDHAASTPALESVVRAVETATRTYSSVHRGTGWLSRVTSAHYEAAREEVARFVGARADDVVVLTRTTTDATNLLARALPEGTPVLVFASEHHASLLPWPAATTHRLPVPASPEEALGRLEAALLGLAGGPAPLVVVTGASNVTGELWPVERAVAVARRHGARVLLD